MKYSDEELLNWAMNQLYRAARTIQLLEVHGGNSGIIGEGCDWTAETILERLKSTKSGLKLVKETNKKLLKQKCPKKIRKLMNENS